MANFSADELVDWVRHQFRTEDDTGICCRVLPKPERFHSFVSMYIRNTIVRIYRRPTTSSRLLENESSDESDVEEEAEEESLEAFYSRNFNVRRLGVKLRSAQGVDLGLPQPVPEGEWC